MTMYDQPSALPSSAMTEEQRHALRRLGADPAWRRFYVVGGVSSALYVLFALILPAVLTFLLFPRFWEVLDDAPELLPWIADHALGWHVIQGATLESSIFLILTFVALWLALRHLDQVWSAVGAIVAITSQILFMAYYPVLLGLAYLGERYPTVGGAEQQSLVAAAEGLVAQNSGFNPVYEALLAVGVIILSLVMLRGVFPRWVGYLGILTGAVALTAIVLHPVLGLGYLLWWVFLIAWLVAIAWYLTRLGLRPVAVGRAA
jgi:hypothetical protein